jgi:aminopeptidase N
VLNVDADRPLRPARVRPDAQGEWPLALSEPGSDLLTHELAHQWWGGLVSWRDPSDNWITEGLATYCSLTYLRQSRGDRVYQGALKRFRRWVKRFAAAGAACDGGKLKLPGRDVRAYQALVYAKPALMLAELAAAVGEGELDRRLRAILESRRGSNLDSREFLEMLSAGDGRQLARLNEWIFAKGLPLPR